MKDSNLNGLIKKTEDYSIFKFTKDNRPIDESHVKKLAESMKEHNDNKLKPVIVNSKMEVVDGQHRLKACELLNLPVFYVIDDNYTPEKIIHFNSIQKLWKTVDYLNYWVEHGKEDYKKLNDFSKDIGFNIGIILKWLSRVNGNKYVNFRKGCFVFKLDERTLESIMATKKFIKTLKSRNTKPVNMFLQGAFHDACRQFFNNPLVNCDRFFEKFDIVPYTIAYGQGSHDYIDQFVEIYNYNMKKQKIQVIREGVKRELQEKK